MFRNMNSDGIYFFYKLFDGIQMWENGISVMRTTTKYQYVTSSWWYFSLKLEAKEISALDENGCSPYALPTLPTPILASHIYHLFQINYCSQIVCHHVMVLCVCIMSNSEVIFYLRMKLPCTDIMTFHFYESEMHSGSAFHCVNKHVSSQDSLTAGCHLLPPSSLTILFLKCLHSRQMLTELLQHTKASER